MSTCMYGQPKMDANKYTLERVLVTFIDQVLSYKMNKTTL